MNDLLLVIDMQNVYLPDQPWACETVAHTKANILKLLEKHPKNQTIFTRYIAAEHPVGTWKTYNELNRKINEDPWMNELMDGIKEAAETYLIYDKSTYSSFQVPAIRQAAREADRIILTTDDPWTEDPADICRQMEEALPADFPHETVLDRAAAIDHAFDLAEKCGRRAVVMLLGKGSDATQHVANGYEDVETDSALAARHIAAHDAR